ncbi:hypothetical protein HDU93_001699, partial [Gonapodya sp. JEL0774]
EGPCLSRNWIGESWDRKGRCHSHGKGRGCRRCERHSLKGEGGPGARPGNHRFWGK